MKNKLLNISRIILSILFGFLFIFLIIKYKTISLIIFIVLAVIYLIFYFITKKGNNELKRITSSYSSIVFGFKGSGKDLLMQTAIYLRFHKKYKRLKKLKEKGKIELIEPLYFSNLDYGFGGEILDINNISVAPNDFESFLNDNIKVIPKNEKLEGKDYFHSDTGIFLPSYADNLLNKKYKSLPIAYALSRHLWNMNITFNTQSLSRVWLKLREQQDCYIQALYTIPKNKSFLSRVWFKIPILKKYIFIKWRYYEKYESALNGLLPFSAKNRLGEITKGAYLSAGTATKKEYESLHGKIRNYYSVIKVKNIKYDTRFYHSILFGKSI